MKAYINDTEIDIHFSREDTISYLGSKDSYEINYGNGLKEVGGIVEVQCSEVKTGVIEGTYNIQLPFNNTFDFQATAMNVSIGPNTLTGESCFITEIPNGYKIYATANSTENKTIPVKWSAKGVI